MIAAGWMDAGWAIVNERFKTTEQGAATSVWCATSPRLNGMGGLYCEDCDVAKLTQSRENRASPASIPMRSMQRALRAVGCFGRR